LRRLREAIAEQVSVQERLDKIVVLIAANMVAESERNTIPKPPHHDMANLDKSLDLRSLILARTASANSLELAAGDKEELGERWTDVATTPGSAALRSANIR
jgi:hypothetical protein